MLSLPSLLVYMIAHIAMTMNGWYMQSLKVSEAIKAVLQIVINANASVADLVGTERLAQRQARIGGLRVLRSHPPEGQLDDARRIEADAQLQQKDSGMLMCPQEIIIGNLR